MLIKTDLIRTTLISWFFYWSDVQVLHLRENFSKTFCIGIGINIIIELCIKTDMEQCTIQVSIDIIYRFPSVFVIAFHCFYERFHAIYDGIPLLFCIKIKCF